MKKQVDQSYFKKWNPDVDYKKSPELYHIGRGQQGVLICEPYKSLICKHWRFKTVPEAVDSSEKILIMFYDFIQESDFVGADMAKKFLHMGYTRSRRYANHRSGKKYDNNGNVKPQEPDHWTCDKAESARIFKKAYDSARRDPDYQVMYRAWRKQENVLH